MVNKKTIEFRIKKTDNKDVSCDIEIYKVFPLEDGSNKLVHVDTIRSMTMMELWRLKIFLQEYLQNNDWYF